MSINKFLVSKKPIEIEIEYLEVDGEAIVIKDKSLLSEEAQKKVKVMRGRFRRPSFQTFNSYIKDAVEPDGEGGSYVNFNKMREYKFRTLLIEIEDADGTIYEAKQNYAMLTDLHPEIASTFLDRLETVVDEDRFKKMLDSGLFKEEKESKEGDSGDGAAGPEE